MSVETGGRGDSSAQPETSDKPDTPEINDQIALDESNRHNREGLNMGGEGGGGGAAVQWSKKSAEPPDFGKAEGSERLRKSVEYWESKLGLVIKG